MPCYVGLLPTKILSVVVFGAAERTLGTLKKRSNTQHTIHMGSYSCGVECYHAIKLLIVLRLSKARVGRPNIKFTAPPISAL